jgi:hypothetical protein
MKISVDDREIELAETVVYKGIMFSGLPNLAATMGYTNASWTLKADLAAGYVCRLLDHMDRYGYRVCTPTAPEGGLPKAPWLDLVSGYVLRSVDSLPKQGARTPWRLHQNYARDLILLRYGTLEDEAMQFGYGGSSVSTRRSAPALEDSIAS